MWRHVHESCGYTKVAASGQAEITFSSEPSLLAVDDLLSFGDQVSSAGYCVMPCALEGLVDRC